jgi:hypothetical protein
MHIAALTIVRYRYRYSFYLTAPKKKSTLLNKTGYTMILL